MAAEKKKTEKPDLYGKKHTARCSKEVKENRIERMIEWISVCKPVHEMLRLAKEEWGVSTSQAESYLRQARARIRERWDGQDRKDFVAGALEQMQKVAQMSIASGQGSNAIGAVNLQAKLLQITTRDN